MALKLGDFVKSNRKTLKALKCGAGEEGSFGQIMLKEEVLQILKETRKADCSGHFLHRNYLLYHVTEGKAEGKTRTKT